MVKNKIKVIWDDEAKRSLRSIYDYLKSKESIQVAKKVRDEITAQAKELVIFPEKFEKEPVLKDEPGNYRYKVVCSYKIIYEVTTEAIYILDIFHTSRNPSHPKK